MDDLTFSTSGEFDVTQIEGNTDEGIEFIDAWSQGTFNVVDSGRIIVPGNELPTFEEAAAKRGLTIGIVQVY